jgi:hypothetical protein
MLILARRRRRQRLVHASAHSKLAATLDVEKMKADASDDSENNEKDAEGIDADSTVTSMGLSQRKSRLSIPRILLFSLSVVSLLIGAAGATSHYLSWSWGNRAHPIGWLLSMLFLLVAFAPPPRESTRWLKSLIRPWTAFFLFWILFFIVSHLWNFHTSPWNGNALFDESGWDLYFLKSRIMGHPFQPVWPDHTMMARETLFHYYVWAFLRLFGYNILSYEAAIFVIWCTIFVFTLLLGHLLFRSYIVTSATALVFNFLPFAFIFTFAGYRYPMSTALGVVSLYFLHLGFKSASSFCLSLGGVTAGLCLAAAIPGKQYVLVLVLFALLYTGLHLKTLKPSVNWGSVSLVVYGFLAGAMPILFYIIFNYAAYTRYEKQFVDQFLNALLGKPSRGDLAWYTTALWRCFFNNPGERQFIPDVLPIPLPYYFFLLPGLVLAVVKRRYEIAMLAIIPVLAGSVAHAEERRVGLLPMPFWIILMAFTFAAILQPKWRTSFKICLWGASVIILMFGLFPSIQYIRGKTKSPFSVYHFAQAEVAASRFLKNIVAGREPTNPHLEHDELKRHEGPDAPYDTLICPNVAYSTLHLFLYDYGDQKILSFCGGSPMFVMAQQEIWRLNKKAIADYVSRGKDLKLIWQIEDPPKTDKIIKMYEPLRQLATERTISYSFVSGNALGGGSKFCVLDVPSQNITEFQKRVRNLPDFLQPTAKPTPTPPPPPLPISGEWTHCANETEQCNFSGTKQVRYGANDIYNYGTFTRGVLCANSIFGDPISWVVKHCDYADIIGATSTPTPTPKPIRTPATDGWTHCANETEQCNFSRTKQVRYGANDIYNYGTFTGGVLCANSIFGDPNSWVVKHCDYADSIEATPTPTRRLRQRSR